MEKNFRKIMPGLVNSGQDNGFDQLLSGVNCH